MANKDRGKKGALDGGSPMSPVGFKKWQSPLSLFLKFPVNYKKKVQCHLSNSRNDNVPCRNSFFKCSYRFQDLSMSPVKFEKRPCRPAELKGQWPLCTRDSSRLSLDGDSLYSYFIFHLYPILQADSGISNKKELSTLKAHPSSVICLWDLH